MIRAFHRERQEESERPFVSFRPLARNVPGKPSRRSLAAATAAPIVVRPMDTWFDDAAGWREMDENPGGRLVVQHGGVDHATIEESFTCYVSRCTDRAGVCEFLRIEVSRQEQLVGNAGLDRRGLGEQRLVRLDAPAIGIGMVEIGEGYGLRQDNSVGGHQLVDVSVGIAERAARLLLPMAHAHVSIYVDAIKIKLLFPSCTIMQQCQNPASVSR